MRLAPRIKRAIAVVEVLYELAPQVIEDVELNQFPRDIEKLILYGLEIPVIRLPKLTINTAAEYLCVLWRDAIWSKIESDNRPLYGLLHVGPPSNVIFVRENLPQHIINYIMAHEIGHFLADVFLVRELWLKTLPEQKVAIERAFAWDELDTHLELQALIKGLPARPKTITGRGKKVTNEITDREIQADLIARELLAPWNEVVPLFKPNARPEMILLLHQRFGLPQKIAWYYYSDLQNYINPPSTTLDRLFAPLLHSSSKNSSEN